jgi:hypothetical protein
MGEGVLSDSLQLVLIDDPTVCPTSSTDDCC